MTHIWKYAGALAMVISLAAYAGAMTTLQEEQILEGELLNVAFEPNVLTMKAAEDKEMRFTFNEETQIIGAEKGIQGLSGQAGTRLKIHYKTEGESLIATRIEVAQ